MGSHLPLISDVEGTTQALAEEAKGIFLWAVLALSQMHYDIYFETTKSKQHYSFWLPATLDAAYETIIQNLWHRHDKTRRGMARDAFTLVLCAQRPLSILELRSALASMHYDSHLLSPLNNSEVDDWGIWNKLDKIQNKGSLDVDTQLMLLCGGLLQVAPRQAKSANDRTDTDYTVHFIHRTARDFLLEKGSCLLDGDLQTPKLPFPELEFSNFQLCNAQHHFRTAWICLVYVDHTYERCDQLNTETAMNSALFLDYSLSFGMEHLILAERAGVNPMNENMCWLPTFQKGFVDHWSLLHSRIYKDQRLFEPHKTKAVHLMSYYGLPWHDTGVWGASLAEVNEEDHHGQTPLSLAAAVGHHHILKMLLDHGADIGHRDHVYGQTPLSQAAAYGHKEVVELLLSKGADYDDNSSGVTPLWLAIRSGHRDIAELLLHAGANAKASSIHTGESCLSHAASLGDIKTAHLLLEQGAEVVTRDSVGWSPLHYAVSQGRKKMIELLLGSLKLQELFKLRDKLFKDKVKGSWVNTVLTAIVIMAYCQRGGEGQTSGNQNRQALSTRSNGRLLRTRGNKPQKHKLGAGKEEDDNEENSRGNSEKRRRRSDPNGLRFACPYHKKNRTRFPSGPCNGKGFENIDRLK